MTANGQGGKEEGLVSVTDRKRHIQGQFNGNHALSCMHASLPLQLPRPTTPQLLFSVLPFTRRLQWSPAAAQADMCDLPKRCSHTCFVQGCRSITKTSFSLVTKFSSLTCVKVSIPPGFFLNFFIYLWLWDKGQKSWGKAHSVYVENELSMLRSFTLATCG